MRIAVLAPFSSFADSYSLAHAVHQQCRALDLAGHDVELWTLDNLKPHSEPMLDGIAVRPIIPTTVWEVDKTTPAKADKIRMGIAKQIEAFRPNAIITHDALFQAWYVDSARAIHELKPRDCNGESFGVRWFHTAHSVVSPHFSPPVGDQVYRRTLPDGHEIIGLNWSDRERLAAYYSVSTDRVHVIPNCHDPRCVWDIHPAAEAMIKRADLLNREIVQVYPFCATRTGSKGVGELLRIFRAMQQRGDAALVLADSSADDSRAIDAMNKAIAAADGVEVFRMSQIAGCEKHTPHKAVMDLMRLSNLFIFPTMGEACPLILAEAMQAGCVIAINESVGPLVEYAPHNAIRFRLPAIGATIQYRATVTTREEGRPERVEEHEGPAAERLVLEHIAERCMEAVRLCPGAQAKAAAFRTFSLEAHGRRWEEVLRT